MKTKIPFILLISFFILTAVVFWAQWATRPQSIFIDRKTSGAAFEIAFIGDSIATDMIRSYDFWTDTYRLLTPSPTNDLVTGVGTPSTPLGIVDFLNSPRSLRITNYSRPGADLFTRDFFNEPLQWQRWFAHIPNLENQTNLFINSTSGSQLVALWTGHVDMLYWNSYQGARAAGRIIVENDDQLRRWLVTQWIQIYKTQLRRILDKVKTSPKATVVIFGLINWNSVVSVSELIQKFKKAGDPKFKRAEERNDPLGQIQLWKQFNRALEGLVQEEQKFLPKGQSLEFSPALEDIDLILDDFESDGIHPSRIGKAKIAKKIATELAKYLI